MSVAYEANYMIRSWHRIGILLGGVMVLGFEVGIPTFVRGVRMDYFRGCPWPHFWTFSAASYRHFLVFGFAGTLFISMDSGLQRAIALARLQKEARSQKKKKKTSDAFSNWLFAIYANPCL